MFLKVSQLPDLSVERYELYLIEPEDRGHFSHQGGKGHRDLENHGYSVKSRTWDVGVGGQIRRKSQSRPDLHLDPGEVVSNLKVLPHEEVELSLIHI